MNLSLEQDTIAAIATPPGKGGVGIIRLSGSQSQNIALAISGRTAFKPRYAHYANFYQHQDKDKLLDQGIILFFNGPHSFTGEDVVELQGHGGPVILDAILQECIRLGARMARPGEFSERAFLNNKIDLAQAEAIADLIDSASIEAAKNAVRSLQGEFSKKIHHLVEKVIELRLFVEAAIDFPEEEIDFLNDGRVKRKLDAVINECQQLIAQAQQGRILQEGMKVVIAGKPNAGKSSLLNALAGFDAAIVTDIAGTTRDVLKENILIDGMPLHIIDTAGLRDSPDIVEQEGIRRAWQAIDDADAILLVIDASKDDINNSDVWPEFTQRLSPHHQLTIIANKCDLTDASASVENNTDGTAVIHISAKQHLGIDLLRNHLKLLAGFQQESEGNFTARRRHLGALEKALDYLDKGNQQLIHTGAGELLAEDLRYCQQHLNEITGEFSADDLLGKIFSSFCIGK